MFKLHEPICVFMGLGSVETALEGEKVIILSANPVEKLSLGCFLAKKAESVFSKIRKANTVEP